MNASELYLDREDLLTPSELEEFHHDMSSEAVPILTPNLRKWLLDDVNFSLDSHEAASRRQFERRPPALGATPALLAELHTAHHVLPPVQQRILLRSLRESMCWCVCGCMSHRSLAAVPVGDRREFD